MEARSVLATLFTTHESKKYSTVFARIYMRGRFHSSPVRCLCGAGFYKHFIENDMNEVRNKSKQLFWKSYLIGFLLTGLTLSFLAYKTAIFPTQDYKSLVLIDLDGNKVDLAQYQSQPLVVNYWATWCGPCIEEFPELDLARKTFKGHITFIMISDDAPEKVRKYVKRNNYGFTFLTSKAPLKLNIRPVTYFYSGDKNSVYKNIGSLNRQALYTYLGKIK